MKKCLKCGQSYTDDTLNFCLNDGELLTRESRYAPPPTQFADDAPPTLMMDQPRVTNPVDFAQGAPAAWQNQSPQAAGQLFGIAGYATRDQTLPTISLILGIVSFFLVCCAGGIWLGVPAAIVGYLAMRNVEKDPTRYGGRSMAITGMVLGIITFLASLFFLIFGRLS
ncbi:MAG TPA: DUF4190 domain-containing protein [Pyrinomonadaceae bacterium]